MSNFCRYFFGRVVFSLTPYLSIFVEIRVNVFQDDASPVLAPNARRLGGRAGVSKSWDGSKRCCYLLCVRRGYTPACVKPLVSGRPFCYVLSFQTISFYKRLNILWISCRMINVDYINGRGSYRI